MQADITCGKFIEYGEYKGNLYGTSSESVISLVEAGYMCVLSPHYQALKMLRTPQLKPYIVYIKPPRFEVLKETRCDSRARSTFDETNSRAFTVRLFLRDKTYLYSIFIKAIVVLFLKSFFFFFFFKIFFFFFFSQDDELNEIVRSAERIEFLYSHLFDETVVNADLAMAYEQLLHAIQKLDTEPMWVPTCWV